MFQHPALFRAASLLTCAAAVACAPGGERTPPAPRTSIPAPDGDASIRSVEPRSGHPGTDVTLRAGGFTPESMVQVGFGPPESEYEVVDVVRTDARGDVAVTVSVPSWAERGREYLFVVADEDARPKAVSGPFLVTTDDGRVRVEGEVSDEGVECPAMRSRSGRLYTLAGGDTSGLQPGDRVVVEGRIAEMSFCQQGTTLEVSRIQRR